MAGDTWAGHSLDEIKAGEGGWPPRRAHLLGLEPSDDGRLAAVVEADDDDAVLAARTSRAPQHAAQFFEQAHLTGAKIRFRFRCSDYGDVNTCLQNRERQLLLLLC